MLLHAYFYLHLLFRKVMCLDGKGWKGASNRGMKAFLSLASLALNVHLKSCSKQKTALKHSVAGCYSAVKWVW